MAAREGRTTYGTVVGSVIAFADRGMHALEGVPGRWPIFAVRRDASAG